MAGCDHTTANTLFFFGLFVVLHSTCLSLVGFTEIKTPAYTKQSSRPLMQGHKKQQNKNENSGKH